MEDLFVWLVLVVVGAWLGWHARGIHIIANLARNPQSVIRLLERMKELDQETQGLGQDLEVELREDQGQFYCWTHTGEFLGQGSTREAAIARAEQARPGQRIWLKESGQSNQTA